MTHICIINLTIIASDNGLSPGRRQAIICTNERILLIEPLGTKFSEILLKVHTFSFKKMHLKMASILSRPQWVNQSHGVCYKAVTSKLWQLQYQVKFVLKLENPHSYNQTDMKWNPRLRDVYLIQIVHVETDKEGCHFKLAASVVFTAL